jgi:hypothetical protein
LTLIKNHVVTFKTLSTETIVAQSQNCDDAHSMGQTDLPPFSVGFVSIAAVLALMPTGFVAAKRACRASRVEAATRALFCQLSHQGLRTIWIKPSTDLNGC